MNFTFIKNGTRLRHTAFAVAPRWRHVIKCLLSDKPPVEAAICLLKIERILIYRRGCNPKTPYKTAT